MSKTQIYLGINKLDFTGIVNVKRQLTDYRDLSIGTSNKSYTIDIPMTPSNTVLLQFINDLRSRGEVTDEAKIITDGIELIRGTIRILSFTELYAKIIIEADDWISEVGANKINDLSWGAAEDHTFNASNISDSWIAGPGAFYRYPLINFAELVSGDYTSNGAKLYPFDFYPCWKIADIVEKIFAESGYTLASGGFFDSATGQSLYQLSASKPNEHDHILGKGLKVYVDDKNDNYDSASIAGGTAGTLQVNQVLVMGGESRDEGNDYSITTNRYTAPEDGTYRFQAQVQVFSTMHNPLASWSVVNSSITWSIRKNGVALVDETVNNTSVFDMGNSFDLDTGYIHLDGGDHIEVYVFLTVVGQNTSANPLTAVLHIREGVDVSYLRSIWNEQCLWPGIGKTMNPSNYLPDIDAVDFLNGLKQVYNLRFFMDRMNRTIYIETSDNFYGATVKDLSDKVDYSHDLDMRVLASKYRRTQIFKFKPDTSDKAYTNEVSANGVPFQKKYVLGSSYAIPGSKTNENVVFSPTPTGDMPQIGHYSYQKIPRIFGSDEFVSSWRPYPAYRAKKWNPRLLEWKGMVALTTGMWVWHANVNDPTGTNYTTFPSVVCPDMNDMFNVYLAKDWRRIDENKLLTCVVIGMNLIEFNTVIGTAANEGFRATYKLNIEGVDMFFILNKIVTDGDRVKCEFVQKL